MAALDGAKPDSTALPGVALVGRAATLLGPRRTIALTAPLTAPSAALAAAAGSTRPGPFAHEPLWA